MSLHDLIWQVSLLQIVQRIVDDRDDAYIPGGPCAQLRATRLPPRPWHSGTHLYVSKHNLGARHLATELAAIRLTLTSRGGARGASISPGSSRSVVPPSPSPSS